MKVFEILRNDVKVLTEQQVIDRMKRFDWMYEFSDNAAQLSAGNRELELIENMVYQLWKINPDKTVQLWNTHCPDTPTDKTIVPSFILRLKAQDDESK